MKIFSKIKNNPIYINVVATILAIILLGFLAKTFSHIIEPIFIYLRYWLCLLLINYISILITLCLSIICLSLIWLKRAWFKRKISIYFLIIFILILNILIFIYTISSLNKGNAITFYTPNIITRNIDGSYMTDTAVNKEILSGFKEGFYKDTLKINNILLLDEKISLKDCNIPKSIFDYYSFKDLSLKKLFLDYKKCLGVVNWLEVDKSGSVINVGIVNKFLVIVNDSNIGESFQLKTRINRLTQLGLLSDFSKGIYFGKVYRAIIEQSFVSEYINKNKYEDAFSMINNSEEEFLSLISFLRNGVDSLRDNESKEIAFDYINEDLNAFNFYINYMRSQTSFYKKDYVSAEKYLKKMFEISLYPNKTNYDSYLKAFQNHYFINKASSTEDAMNRFLETGISSNFSEEDYNGMGLFYLLKYARQNPDFAFNEFYQWLSKKHPNNPVVYIFWGKAFTDKGNFNMAIEKYEKAIQIYPNSAVLKVLYGAAVFNRDIRNTTDEDKIHDAEVKWISEIKKIMDAPEMVNFEFRDSCKGSPLNWEWCAN